MPSSEEKNKRKALKHAAREAERDWIRSTIPILPIQMKALFDFVDEQLSAAECDHSLRYVLLFLSRQKLVAGPVVAWLEGAGAYCDCEVLANAEEDLLRAFPNDNF